jgi:predicted  nucleic acid-binding Zn-ribbon protein
LVTWAPHSARGRGELQHRVAELDRSELAACEALREAVARTKRLELALDSIRAANRRNALRRADQQADERELVRYAAARLPD